MPAMNGDPITASLSRSLGGHSSHGHGLMRGGNSSSVTGSMSLEARLAATASAKKMAASSVQFDSPVKYGGGGSSDANKRFIILNPHSAKQVGTRLSVLNDTYISRFQNKVLVFYTSILATFQVHSLTTLCASFK